MSSTIRANLLAYHNNYRKSHGVRHALALNSFLNKTADLLAEQAGSRNSWFDSNHRRQWNGQSFGGWVDNHTKGTKYYYGRFLENLARPYANSPDAFNAWVASSDHRKNILDGRVTQVGFGIYNSTKHGRYWVAHFWGA
jgi:uncharacterized protein YkwD